MIEVPAGQRSRERCLEEVKCDFDVGLPVDGELLPALLVERRSRRQRACAENEDRGLKDVEDFGGRAFLRCVQRQNLGAGDLFG